MITQHSMYEDNSGEATVEEKMQVNLLRAENDTLRKELEAESELQVMNKFKSYVRIVALFKQCFGMRKGVSSWYFSCIYSTTHNSAIIQLVQSKFDIYIVFVPFCMHPPFCWHSINDV